MVRGQLIHEYLMARRRVGLLVIFSMGLLILPLFIADLLIGAYKLSFMDVVRALIGAPVPRDAALVVWQLRVPEALASLILGTSLASSGAVLQMILRNPLASTYTLGVSAAAGFGAALAIIMGAGYVVRYYLPVVTQPYFVILGAFVMASLASLLVYVLSFIKGASPTAVILAGVAVMFMFSTGTSLLQYLGNPDATHAVVMWLLGSVTNVIPNYIPYMSLSLLAIPYYLVVGWQLNALNLGDDVAHSLGVDVKGLRLTIIAVSAFQAAATISFVGLVGFVDLVTPNIARIIVGNEARRVVVASALMGADITLLADIVSKVLIPPYVIPIGVVLALIGAPYLLSLVLTRGARYAE